MDSTRRPPPIRSDCTCKSMRFGQHRMNQLSREIFNIAITTRPSLPSDLKYVGKQTKLFNYEISAQICSGMNAAADIAPEELDSDSEEDPGFGEQWVVDTKMKGKRRNRRSPHHSSPEVAGPPFPLHIGAERGGSFIQGERFASDGSIVIPQLIRWWMNPPDTGTALIQDILREFDVYLHHQQESFRAVTKL
ncbi:hypothetical protein P175DRAFT_0531920 [Aspergillus ochraceoroseus IBT 24754]|uniref:Uncharacterized protein n=1 Tax=Aspergillus ochraceoroseus IBT 24754 TaxID=1392256 RepID=A0A2T5LWB7_9EURO|nr:uncharacterized protein P175DRAFT_0531920 [Aspergillus ochraceoroseus IBT 24754]PTU20579.1 hypothetical protein P175DRAFT_0531920 [Aspergillus ochraceoroseus IBT 24754]